MSVASTAPASSWPAQPCQSGIWGMPRISTLIRSASLTSGSLQNNPEAWVSCGPGEQILIGSVSCACQGPNCAVGDSLAEGNGWRGQCKRLQTNIPITVTSHAVCMR